MFHNIVTNLSYSPAAASQLSFYMRRLRGENITRRLSFAMALGLAAVQIATIAAPPSAATASSTNDVIYGGISSAHPKTDLLNVYDNSADSAGHSGYRQLFDHFGITRADLENAKPGTVNSGNHKIKSVGRNKHTELDEPFQIGTQTLYTRPLYTWGDNLDYPALVGRKASNGGYFAIMYACGNIALTDNTYDKPEHTPTPTPSPTPTPTTVPQPTPTPQPTPPPTPSPTPYPKPTPAPAPTPTPVTPPVTGVGGAEVPHIVLHKSAVVVSALDGTKHDPASYTAGPGDVTEYTLSTKNNGTASAKDYVVSEALNDVLEYADVLDPRGGTLKDGVMTWPKTTIKPGQEFLTTLATKIKSPIPVRPTSISDPQSFDLKLDNVYGNAIQIKLAVPVEKQVEITAATLPQTGTGINTIIVMVLLAAISYFYFRNRQLITEVSILRAENHGESL